MLDFFFVLINKSDNGIIILKFLKKKECVLIRFFSCVVIFIWGLFKYIVWFVDF